MKCEQAQEWIRCHRLFAEGLGDEEASALAEHLAECPACAKAMDREEAFDEAVRPVMMGVPIPIGLEEKVRWAMRRSRRARQRTMALYASLAAAAALLMA